MAGLNTSSFYNPNSFDFSSLLQGSNGALGMGSDLGSGITIPSLDTSSLGSTSALGSQLGSGSTGLGWNMPTANLALSGISSLGNLWGALQSANLARDQFNYTKNVTDTNLANSIKSYNTSLADRIAARASVTGMSAADQAAYLAKNSLTR